MAGNSGIKVVVVKNHLPHLAASINRAGVVEVKRAAYNIEAQAKRKAPVRTGTLRRSIHSVFTNGGTTGIVAAGVDYDIFVERGTRHMAARPFLVPAAEAVFPTFVARLKAVIDSIAQGGPIPQLPAFPDLPPLVNVPKKPKRKKATVKVKKKTRAKTRAPKHFESAGFKEAARRHREYLRSSNAASKRAQAAERRRRKRTT